MTVKITGLKSVFCSYFICKMGLHKKTHFYALGSNLSYHINSIKSKIIRGDI